MKKYVGLVKEIKDGWNGPERNVYAKFSDDWSYLEEWFKMYPKAVPMIMENDIDLTAFFGGLDDGQPVTEEEKKEQEREWKNAMKRIKELRKQQKKEEIMEHLKKAKELEEERKLYD